MADAQAKEKRFPLHADMSEQSAKVLNTLQQQDQLDHGLKASQCKKGKYVDEAFRLLAEKRGIKFE